MAQQVDHKKLKRKEREQLKRKEKNLQDSASLQRSVRIDEQDAEEVEIERTRVIMSFSSLLV